jgi:hypothetical protein
MECGNEIEENIQKREGGEGVSRHWRKQLCKGLHTFRFSPATFTGIKEYTYRPTDILILY